MAKYDFSTTNPPLRFRNVLFFINSLNFKNESMYKGIKNCLVHDFIDRTTMLFDGLTKGCTLFKSILVRLKSYELYFSPKYTVYCIL